MGAFKDPPAPMAGPFPFGIFALGAGRRPRKPKIPRLALWKKPVKIPLGAAAKFGE